MNKLRFTSDRIDVIAEAGEQGERRIDAVAVPYNVFATVSGGQEVSFMPGSLPVEGKAPRVFMYHDSTKPVGIVAERVDTAEGMLATMKISRTQLGDEALTLAADGVFDVSVGVNVIKATTDDKGRMIVESAEWLELSLVPVPAFNGAIITDVAAEAENEPDTTDPTPTEVEETEQVDTTPTPEVVEASTPTPLFAQPTRQFRLPSAAEYLAAMYVGGSDFAQLNANIRAAAGDVVVSDSVVPEPIVQPLFDDINAQRPVVSALGVRAMPQLGKVFIRPRIKTHVEVSEQQTELTGVAAQTMEVEEVQVTKKTFSGQATLSEQVIDWSDPSMLTSVLNDLTAQYSLATESEAIDTMAAAIDSNNREVTDLTDPVEVINDIFGIAAAIASVGNYLPTHIIVSPSVWAKLGSLKGTNDQQIFPMMTTTNNMGVLPGGATAWNGNPLGLQLVVSNQIKTQSVQGNDAKDYLFLANARFMENYEQQKGALSIEVGGGNAVLGRTVAFRGYFASVVMDPKLVWALGPAV
jgi:HK97 family phage prohead protease